MENLKTKAKKIDKLTLIEDELYGYEPYFEKDVTVAYINHDRKEVSPCHGYFFPHPLGKASKKYAKSIGYVFNND
jgi:hypothetical protein